MAAPVFVGFQQTAWNTATTPKTTAVTAASVGDVVVAVAGAESNIGVQAIAGTGVTLSLLQEITTAGRSQADLYGGVVASAGNVSASISNDGVAQWFGGAHAVFGSSAGLGSSAKVDGSTNGQIALTTTQDNSAVLVFIVDFNAVDGAGRTWLSVNGAPTERVYSFEASRYTVTCVTYADVGAAGAKTLGRADGAGLLASVFAVEVKGTAGAPPTKATKPYKRRSRIATALRDIFGLHSNTAASWFDPSIEFGDAGSANSHATSGALAAQAAALAGAAQHRALHATSGALTTQAALIAGTAAHPHVTSGALAAQPAALAGAASHAALHATSGALSAQSAALAGSAARASGRVAAGALQAQPATLAGVASHSTLHATAGSLQAQPATVNGAAQHAHVTAGSLLAQAALVSGAASHAALHATSGALAAEPATIAGDALRFFGPQTHTTTGALLSGAAQVNGLALLASQFTQASTGGPDDGDTATTIHDDDDLMDIALTLIASGILEGPHTWER